VNLERQFLMCCSF